MKIKMEVTGLDIDGEGVRVDLKGMMDGMAGWRRPLYWSIRLPSYCGKNYRLGQNLKIEVNT